MNSRTKGKRGELEVAQFLRNHGFEDAKRGVQYCGLQGNADIVGVDGLHIEVKRTEQFNDEKALQQAERDARKNELPTVWHRRNGEKLKVTLRAEEYCMIWNELSDRQIDNIKTKMRLKNGTK